MRSYWSSFPEFDHNPKTPIKQEFRRLAQLKGWIGNDLDTRRIFQKEWGKCFRFAFEKHFGRNASSLAGWQSLCREVRLEVIPGTVEECRDALKGKVWVNIVDLVDCRESGEEVELFESEEDLREYTRREGKTFPKKEAKRNGFLAALLIVVF